MAWLKDVYLDVVVLLIIAAFAVYGGHILYVVLWVYTGLLFFSKVLALFMPSLQRKANKTSAPSYIYHLIYALTVALLLFTGYYYLGGLWVAVWITSFIAQPKRSAKASN